jgi:hypothetical protein
MSDRTINIIFMIIGATTIVLMVHHMREWRLSQARIEILMSKGCNITDKEKTELSELVKDLVVDRRGRR